MKGIKIKKLLGFDSPHSWMKWLKMSFALVALIIAGVFWISFAPLIMSGGIIGPILALIAFVFLFGPILLVMLGMYPPSIRPSPYFPPTSLPAGRTYPQGVLCGG